MREYGQAIWQLQLRLETQGNTKQEASDKTAELIAEINGENNICVVEYSTGNSTNLFACINNSSLPFMDAGNKSFLITELS